MKYRKEIEFELTNQEIGDLIYAGGNLETMANILNNFVDGATNATNATNVLTSDVMADIIAEYLDKPACEFFKELANDIKIKEAEEAEEEEEPMFEEVPEPEEKIMRSLTTHLRCALQDKPDGEQLERVKVLVARGVNINYRPPVYGTDYSIAFLCALWNLPEILKYLISVGLDISIPCSTSQGGDTAIVCARRSDKKEIIEILEAAQKPVEAVAAPEEEESTETFHKVGDRFVLNAKGDFYPHGDTFEIISATENSICLRKIDGDFHSWVNKDYQKETTVTDKNKITEEEWECITDNRVENFRKIKIEAETAPEEKEETFYHVGQLFKIDNAEVYKIISHNGKEDAIRFQKIHGNYYIWFNSYNCLTTDVINPDKITKSEFKVITDNCSSSFTPITQEEADKLIAAFK